MIFKIEQITREARMEILELMARAVSAEMYLYY
jgi:hypothetical protein